MTQSKIGKGFPQHLQSRSSGKSSLIQFQEIPFLKRVLGL
jgi:hypothetical protein